MTSLAGTDDPLRHLAPLERDCLLRYCALLRERLGGSLVRLVLFGSAARGDMWEAGSPMHSDIDLLVATAEALPPETAEQLVNETYPLYLECGRQIGPQFRSAGELSQSQGERAAVFAENLARTGSSWPSEEAGAQATRRRPCCLALYIATSATRIRSSPEPASRGNSARPTLPDTVRSAPSTLTGASSCR